MKQGFVKVCAATPDIKVANCKFNEEKIREIIQSCENQSVKFVVFPELCLTGYTCEDLFFQDTLLKSALESLLSLVEFTKTFDILCAVGMPLLKNGRLYNVSAVFQKGKILGFVPKKHIPNYSEFYECRHFAEGKNEVDEMMIDGYDEPVPFGVNLLFRCNQLRNFILGIEICEDLWMPVPPSSYHAMAGATVIANLSASDETTGKDVYRLDLVKNQSARLLSAYLYASAGEGESTTDLVFSGDDFIVENGTVLKRSKRFENGFIISEIDLQRLVNERRKMMTFIMETSPEAASYHVVTFDWKVEETKLTRTYEKTPFVPGVKANRDKRCNEILNIQAGGLKKRLSHTGLKHVVIGLSGGLDSTLALLVIVRAYDSLSLDRKDIIAVTMPCFGTTDRTYNNAVELARQLNVTLKEINIKKAVTVHLEDIEHSLDARDVTYENAQARERTQILMDIANKFNGLVIGTGDMSELALGWATYNGDHISMYGVNCSVPKTLVRYLVLYYAETCENKKTEEILMDVLDTPVSPELLPPENGKISQKTEDLVGPYELHDFFLYYVMRFGFEPSKIYKLAKQTFEGDYDSETILKWMKTFYRRFFSQQFKRSCLPDGPKVGSVALSPRGDLRMPSDACVDLWMEDLKEMNKA